MHPLMAYLFTVGIQAQKNFRNGNDFAIKLDGGAAMQFDMLAVAYLSIYSSQCYFFLYISSCECMQVFWPDP